MSVFSKRNKSTLIEKNDSRFMESHTNRLVCETSPYLKAHSYQHVDWQTWGAEAFSKAEKENKLVFLHIGYSASLWCQKMSSTCFADEVVCELLNTFFVPVIVDKDEHPDVDRYYLEAIHLVAEQDGWPITCFALPDGTPVWGGTYFEADELIDILLNIEHGYRESPHKLVAAGNELKNALANTNHIGEKRSLERFTIHDFNLIVEPWRRKFDNVHGGTQSLPKFPLPNAILFLNQIGYYMSDDKLIQYCTTTLTSIAKGGIKDQLTGGFFHYAHDNAWLIPDFEMITSDNAFLISSFANAYRMDLKKNYLFATAIKETVGFFLEKLTDPNGMFFSSLHAYNKGDSIDGDYYLWNIDELCSVLGNDSSLAIDYFGLTEKGVKEGKNILFQSCTITDLVDKYQLSEEETEQRVADIKQILLSERNKRTAPELDNNIITSYNAAMMQALYDSYLALGQTRYLEHTIKMADYIIANLIKEDRVLRSKTDKQERAGFLDDYAHLIYVFFNLHQETGLSIYLEKSIGLADYVLDKFYDKKSGMFFYSEATEDGMPEIRMMDLTDKTNPSANSMIAMNFTLLAAYTGNTQYRDFAQQMLNNIKPHIFGAGPYVAYWTRVALLYAFEPIMVFCTDISRLKELSLIISQPNVYFVQASPYCVKNSGQSVNGWYYYNIDLSGNEEQSQKAFLQLKEYAMSNKLKGLFSHSVQ